MDEIKDRKSEDTKMKESLRKLADSIGAEAKREERGEDEKFKRRRSRSRDRRRSRSRDRRRREEKMRSLKDVAPDLGTV